MMTVILQEIIYQINLIIPPRCAKFVASNPRCSNPRCAKFLTSHNALNLLPFKEASYLVFGLPQSEAYL